MFWFTLGGLGIWALIDMFTMPGKVNDYNLVIFHKIDEIEKKERSEEHSRQLAMIAAAKG